MHASHFIDRLKGARKTSTGWTARCPAHDDNGQSLSVGIGQDGTILVKCHAGCSAEAIVKALGLEMRALFACNGEHTSTRKFVATYQYRDEAGHVLYESVRYEPKDFKARRPNEHGG